MQLFGQTLLVENFTYPVSDTLKGFGAWNRGTNSVNDVKVVSPGLTFAGYGGSGVGNAVWFNNKPNSIVYTQNLVKIDSGTVYVSYLVKVDSMSAAATSGYNVAMDQFGGATNVNLHSNIQRVNDTTYSMGITKSQQLSYIKKNFSTKKTYLVVLKYTFVPGATTNDSAKVFVFSSGVPAVEPAIPDTFIVAGNDAADMGEIWLSNSFAQSGLQGSSLTVDGLKVGTKWENTVNAPATVNFTEDFNYVEGDSLRGKNGWDVFHGGSTMLVGSKGLTYTGYAGSGIGKAMNIFGGGLSQHPFHTFSDPGTGSAYCSFLVSINGTSALECYIASFGDAFGDKFRAMVYAEITAGDLFFGARPSTNGVVVYDSTKYSTDKTYLIIVKYTYVPGVNNDEVRLYVLSNGVPADEPKGANIGPLLVPSDTIGIGSVIISPGATALSSALNGALITLDGIHVTNSWQKGTTSVRGDLKNDMPEGFALFQNYPNPFNPMTTISFVQRGSAVTTLKVYDLLGKEVAVLLNEKKEPGTYSVQFDASKLSSGVYFYRLQSGGFVETKSMLLLK